MRFGLRFELKEKVIPLDYRRCFSSFLKHCYEAFNKEWYNSMYQNKDPIKKPFTYSVYLGKAKFGYRDIELEEKALTLNFSTFFYDYGINFYNCVLQAHNKPYPFGKDNEITLKSFHLERENNIYVDKVKVKTLSPLLAREHDKSSNMDKYYVFGEEGFERVLKENIKRNCEGFIIFSEGDVEKLAIEPVRVKSSKILHYKQKINGNIGTLSISGKPYLLDFLLKSGMGSRRSQGYGMLEVRG